MAEVLDDVPPEVYRDAFERSGVPAAHVRRYGAEGAVLVLDLDGFGALNDRIGPVAADGLLRAAAERIRDRVRTTDLVSRTADEFRVLLPRGTAAEAMVVARDLRAAIRALGAELTCSIGVAPFA